MGEPQKHSERAHALLSASAANRWIHCNPSAKLEESAGPRESSVYASEGTLAHELCELYLSHDVLSKIDDQAFADRFDEIMSDPLYSEEMLEVVPQYVDYCTEQYKASLSNDEAAIMAVEQKLDLTEYVPGGFGTADCVILGGGTIEVVDYKHGKGVSVYAEWNPQLMLYGLGAMRKFDILYEINTVRVTIVQPRINNISSWEIPASELLHWATEVLAPAAQNAFKGVGEITAGEWCKFCAVKNKCRALAEKNLELAKYDFKDAPLLSDDEIADILKRTPGLVEWANSVQEYAQTEAINNGKAWPGFKLVEGVSRRKWSDEDTVADMILERIPEASEDQIYDMKLKSISAMEKEFGKKVIAEQLSDVIIKPQGKPTLVPLSDKRPAIGIEEAKNDFQ